MNRREFSIGITCLIFESAIAINTPTKAAVRDTAKTKGQERRETAVKKGGSAACGGVTAKPAVAMPVLIPVDRICCGTCQHWKGAREIVEHGKRLRCAAMPGSACYKGSGFKYSPSSPVASHGCANGGGYARWVELPPLPRGK